MPRRLGECHMPAGLGSHGCALMGARCSGHFGCWLAGACGGLLVAGPEGRALRAVVLASAGSAGRFLVLVRCRPSGRLSLGFRGRSGKRRRARRRGGSC